MRKKCTEVRRICDFFFFLDKIFPVNSLFLYTVKTINCKWKECCSNNRPFYSYIYKLSLTLLCQIDW